MFGERPSIEMALPKKSDSRPSFIDTIAVDSFTVTSLPWKAKAVVFTNTATTPTSSAAPSPLRGGFFVPVAAGHGTIPIRRICPVCQVTHNHR
jgi:hypothetical protein